MDDIETEAYRLLVEPTPPRDSRPVSKMKPNTRFLRHIVRNANNHNAALLAKETADSQRRLKDLIRNGKDEADDDYNEDDISTKSRDKHGRDSHRKRSESSKDDDRHARNSRRSDRDRDDRESSRSHRHRGDREDYDDRDDKDVRDRRHRSHRSHHDTHSRSRERHDRHRSSKHRRRSESPEKSREGRLSPPDDRHYRDRSPHRKHRSRHHNEKDSTSWSSGRDQRIKDTERESAHSSRKDRSFERAESHSPSPSRSYSRSDSDRDSALDSDPLDEFVGPRLASDSLRQEKDRVRMKGRGAFSAAALGGVGSSIDRHFAVDYDPSNDVKMQEEAQTAAQATRPAVQPRYRSGGGSSSVTTEDAQTEMQHDRKQLLRAGAERLRAAGFTDREIAIWARGGRREVAPRHVAPREATRTEAKRPKEEPNAPWAKKGEAREWDCGKEADDDGPAKPLWAR